MAPAQLWLVALALAKAIAAAEVSGTADETSLIQVSVGGNSQAPEEKSPFANLATMLKGMQMPGSNSQAHGEQNPLGNLATMLKSIQIPGGADAGFPGFGGFGGPQGMPPMGMPPMGTPPGAAPTAEDIAKGLASLKEVLQNDTLVNLVVDAMETFRTVLKNSTRGLGGRYQHLADSLVTVKLHKDVVQKTVDFVVGEVDAFEADTRLFVKTAVKLVKSMPLGNNSRQIKLMATMVEPFVVQSMDSLRKATAGALEALGNNSEKEFCKGTMPVVWNASSSVDTLRLAHVEVAKMVESLPALKQSPLMFMMPNILPKIVMLGKGVLGVNEATIEHYENQALQLNTTLRSALEDKLGCLETLRSRSSRVSVGMVAMVASAVAWMML